MFKTNPRLFNDESSIRNSEFCIYLKKISNGANIIFFRIQTTIFLEAFVLELKSETYSDHFRTLKKLKKLKI